MSQSPKEVSPKDFDPYHRWLGIPPGHRPPTYYQLLGVSPTESDLEVIHAAALRQSAYVRNFQSGAHAEAASRILSELAEARSTLTDQVRRRQYDARLASVGESQVTPPTATVPDTSATTEEVFGTFHKSRRTGRNTQPRSRIYLLVGTIVLAVGACVAVIASRSVGRRPIDPPPVVVAQVDVPSTTRPTQAVAAAIPPAARSKEIPLTVKPVGAAMSVVAGMADISGSGESRRLVVERPGEDVTIRVEAPGYEAATKMVPTGGQSLPVVIELTPARKWLTDLPAPVWAAEFPAQKVGEHSFSMHPPAGGKGVASAGYKAAGFRTFHAKAAMLRSAAADSQTPLVFEVYGDGKLLWRSEPIQHRGDEEECVCDVTGVVQLELCVACTGGNANAWAAWIDPHLIQTDTFIALAAGAKKILRPPSNPSQVQASATRPAKPKLIAVYKVIFPGDVLLTTNEQEVKNIAKVYPGEFNGSKGHHQEVFGYAHAERQEGTVQLRRYLVGKKREFTTRKIDLTTYKEEGLGGWVYDKERAGTTQRFGFFRLKDNAYEYGPAGKTEFFRKQGYVPNDLKFYLFDKPDVP